MDKLTFKGNEDESGKTIGPADPIPDEFKRWQAKYTWVKGFQIYSLIILTKLYLLFFKFFLHFDHLD